MNEYANKCKVGGEAPLAGPCMHGAVLTVHANVALLRRRLIGNAYRLWSRHGPLGSELRGVPAHAA